MHKELKIDYDIKVPESFNNLSVENFRLKYQKLLIFSVSTFYMTFANASFKSLTFTYMNPHTSYEPLKIKNLYTVNKEIHSVILISIKN